MKALIPRLVSMADMTEQDEAGEELANEDSVWTIDPGYHGWNIE